tara:strand:- start:283 stop:597 length:315 start_codon:yes stop_codon:yes gene_type:complete
MRQYRKSRSTYPNGILLITDSGNKHADRYSVYYEPYKHNGTLIFPYVGMSENPFHPQGFGQHGELDHRYTVCGTNDKVMDFKELPIKCQELVNQDLGVTNGTKR